MTLKAVRKSVLNEEKEFLSILYNIKIANKPILFTEGHTDQKIIETAWSRLRTEPIPFLVIQGFCRTYLRQLLQDSKIHAEARPNPVFGLFDFDDAYNDWNGLAGDTIEIDPLKGCCKKLKNGNVYAYLLPVPADVRLHPQIIKDNATGETYKEDSKIAIEHMFYGHEETQANFEERPSVGGGTSIEFKGNKADFAHKVVPSLQPEAFTNFATLFDSIAAKIPSS